MSFWNDVITAFDKVEWSFESHDPVWAWIIVGMYSVAALIALKACLLAERSGFPREIKKKSRIFWIFLFALMLFLAVNKQLDLQSYLTAVMREVAHSEGWYKSRRSVQRDAIIVLGLLAFLILSYLLYIIYHLPTPYKITLAGAICTFFFIGMRASSFHHMDFLVAQPVWGIKLHILIEISGGVIVSIGGLLSIKGMSRWEKYYKHNYSKKEKVFTDEDEIHKEKSAYLDMDVINEDVDNVVGEIVDYLPDEEANNDSDEIEDVSGYVVAEEVDVDNVYVMLEDTDNVTQKKKVSYDEAASDFKDGVHEQHAEGEFLVNEKIVKSKAHIVEEVGGLLKEEVKVGSGDTSRIKKSQNYWIEIDNNTSGWL